MMHCGSTHRKRRVKRTRWQRHLCICVSVLSSFSMCAAITDQSLRETGLRMCRLPASGESVVFTLRRIRKATWVLPRGSPMKRWLTKPNCARSQLGSIALIMLLAIKSMLQPTPTQRPNKAWKGKRKRSKQTVPLSKHPICCHFWIRGCRWSQFSATTWPRSIRIPLILRSTN